MYLAVDIGGTKVLLAAFSRDGALKSETRFETPKTYPEFLKTLKNFLPVLGDYSYDAAVVAIPGRIDRKNGIILALGNLDWTNIGIAQDVEKLINGPVAIENDANLAGLYEANILSKKYSRVLYITISTGIGTGIITDGIIDPAFEDSEGGHVLVDYKGKTKTWEQVASGKAIVKKYGKRAAEITNRDTWKEIAQAMAPGLLNNIVIIQPEVVIIGGGVGSHFAHFGSLLKKDLKKYETPITQFPPIIAAQKPEEAVIYGCYELAKARYGHPG